MPLSLNNRDGARIVLLHWLVAFCLLVAVMLAPARAFNGNAEFALLMDAETGVVLYQKNANVRMSPASMSKLMTVFMVFEALDSGALGLHEKLFVSDNAWRKGGAASGGSTMFLQARSQVSVENLLRGVIVQSGNDACIVLAEALGGSEENFAQMMTDRAHELGMVNSNFTNSTGIPDPNHKTTAHDLALLTRQIITHFANYYVLFSERVFTWNNIRQNNRNPVLYANIGADGLKTGHTEESGYGLVASAEQNGRRIIMVINGLRSKQQRAGEARKMIFWGQRNFSRETLLAGGEVVTHLPVWHGTSAKVGVAPERRFDIIVPRIGQNKMVTTITYEKPVLTPVQQGDRLGIMKVTLPNMEPQEIPLVAATDVARAGLLGRAFGSLRYLLFGQ